jgi:rsbT co-antagonist protein RsbR
MDEEIQDKENMIMELTAPVILLQPGIGLLPLVGNIDVERGDVIVENTLKQCALKQMDRLYIDLSGVLHINALVAEKIKQLISALQLLGIETTLSGMRPYMAQQAVQLGISFKDVQVVSDLPQALRTNQVPVQ